MWIWAASLEDYQKLFFAGSCREEVTDCTHTWPLCGFALSHIQAPIDIWFSPVMEKHLLICLDQDIKISWQPLWVTVLPGRAVLGMVYARHFIFPHTSPFILYPLPQANDSLPFPSKSAVQLYCPALPTHMVTGLCLVQWPIWRSHKLLFAPSVPHRAAQDEVVNLGKKSWFSRNHRPQTDTWNTKRYSQQILLSSNTTKARIVRCTQDCTVGYSLKAVTALTTVTGSVWNCKSGSLLSGQTIAVSEGSSENA